MKLSKLSPRDQVVLTGLLLLIITMFYGLLRYLPATRAVKETQAEIVTKQNSLKTIKFPDAPKRKVADVEQEQATISKEIPELQESLKTIQASASTDPQEIQIRISDIARNLGVRIRDRRPYGGTNSTVGPARPPGKIDRRAERAQQRAVLRAARAQAAAPTAKIADSADTPIDELLNPPKGGLHDLVARLTNEKNEQIRPLQLLVIETDFRGLQRFIGELEGLSTPISVINLDISVAGKDAPQGMPQPLTAKLVIAL